MPEPKNNPAIKVAKGVRETVNQDGAVLLDIDQGLCFSLNPVATRIWEMIKNGYSTDEIADAFEKEFHLPRKQLVADISDFLQQLTNMRLVGDQSSPVNKRGLLSRWFGRQRST